MMGSTIRGISYHLPEQELTNEELAAEFQDWTAPKILEKTGIASRRIAAAGECASDLGVKACEKLFATGLCSPSDVDYLLFCTQSPDYLLPTTACLMQDRLGLRQSIGALDFNLGCSGYVYGLGLASGLIESGQAKNVLLVTAETYSKFIHPRDKSVRTLFGDGASATLVSACEGKAIGPFVYGTDGRGGRNLIVPTGGTRRVRTAETSVVALDDQGNQRSEDNLFMDGAEIFTFTLKAVPALVSAMLDRAGLKFEDVDHFVFHQANQYMLESLRKKIKIPSDKFPMEFKNCGNTVSSTVPIALATMDAKGAIKRGDRLMLVGFGVGYSWAAAILHW